MDVEQLFNDSETFAAELYTIIGLPLLDDSERVRVSDTLCSLSLEHWSAIRPLLASGLFPSAVVVHRAQFEAILRSLWVLYGASDGELAKLNCAELNAESEQAAKNLPQAASMMEVLAKKAPVEAYKALDRFKTHSWKALNSYTHAGSHALRRHEEGYSVPLIIAALQNANGLAVIACMQAVALSGMQPLQKAVLDLALKYPHCMPAPL